MASLYLCIYIWDIFWGYWLLSALYTRSRVKKVSSGQLSPERTIHLALVVAAYFITLVRFKHFAFWNTIIPQCTAANVIGIMMMLFGLSYAIWARVILGKNWSSAIQRVEGQRLVKSGPYRYIRNPIYSGILFGFAGTVIMLRTPASLTGFLIMLFAYIYKIKKEQTFLIQEFGKEYTDYISESWALIPFIF